VFETIIPMTLMPCQVFFFISFNFQFFVVAWHTFLFVGLFIVSSVWPNRPTDRPTFMHAVWFVVIKLKQKEVNMCVVGIESNNETKIDRPSLNK
jgi:hypothetical protein